MPASTFLTERDFKLFTHVSSLEQEGKNITVGDINTQETVNLPQDFIVSLGDDRKTDKSIILCTLL